MLYHRTRAAVTKVMAPVLASIIAQGVAEGTFRSSDPQSTAEILLQLSAITHDVVARLIETQDGDALRAAIAAFERRLVEQGIAVDRVLSPPDGSVQFIESGFIAAVAAARS